MRLIAAPLDPAHLKPEATWYLTTSLPLPQVSAEQVYEIYRLRDWIEHYYKPVKHELGWADYQVRPERAIVSHWQLVMLAYTFSLLVGALPEGAATPLDAPAAPADAPERGSAAGPGRNCSSSLTSRAGGCQAGNAGWALAPKRASSSASCRSVFARRPWLRAQALAAGPGPHAGRGGTMHLPAGLLPRPERKGQL